MQLKRNSICDFVENSYHLLEVKDEGKEELNFQLTEEEKRGIFLLNLLYFIQGIPFGFFGLAIPFLLIEAGAAYSEIGILSFCLYPFCFKILLAPIEDIYFLKNFGKRKTYIVPSQYVLSFLFFILSFFIQDLINQKNVVTLCIIGFLMILINSIQDVSVDGWNLTLLRNENLSWGAVSQTVGQTLGIILGGNVVILLSEKISLSFFLISFSLTVLLINLWVHFKVNERNPSTNVYSSTWILIKSLKGFYHNKNLRYYVIFTISSLFGFATISNTASLKLIGEGFSKEIITTIYMILIPINLTLSYLMGKYARIGSEMTYFVRFYAILFFNNIFFFILVMQYKNIPQNIFVFLFFFAALIGEGTSTLINVNQGGFTNRISDEEVGGTFITFLNAAWNLGRFGSISLVLFLADILNYTVLALLSWTYIIFYIAFAFKTILRLQKLKKEEWKFI